MSLLLPSLRSKYSNTIIRRKKRKLRSNLWNWFDAHVTYVVTIFAIGRVNFYQVCITTPDAELSCAPRHYFTFAVDRLSFLEHQQNRIRKYPSALVFAACLSQHLQTDASATAWSLFIVYKKICASRITFNYPLVRRKSEAVFHFLLIDHDDEEKRLATAVHQRNEVQRNERWRSKYNSQLDARYAD